MLKYVLLQRVTGSYKGLLIALIGRKWVGIAIHSELKTLLERLGMSIIYKLITE